MLQPPVAMAWAKLIPAMPATTVECAFEPKFDGWRGVLFAKRGFLQSRNNNDLAPRFPEVVHAARSLGDVVLDGEIVALREGRLDFGALTTTSAKRAGEGVTIYYVAFDLLAESAEDVRTEPYLARRERLERALAEAKPPLQLIPHTTDRQHAMQWMNPELAAVGIEGMLIKDARAAYHAGRTGHWRKVRQSTVVDAIVIGVTSEPDNPEELLLARPDETGQLHDIGLSLPVKPAKLRTAIGAQILPTGAPAQRLPGSVFGHTRTEYLPVRPTVVVEVQTEPTVAQFTNRLRPRVHRLRTDLTPADLEPPYPARDTDE